jgi:hypothetical protein
VDHRERSIAPEIPHVVGESQRDVDRHRSPERVARDVREGIPAALRRTARAAALAAPGSEIEGLLSGHLDFLLEGFSQAGLTQ